MQSKQEELLPTTKHQVGSSDPTKIKEQSTDSTLSLSKIKE